MNDDVKAAVEELRKWSSIEVGSVDAILAHIDSEPARLAAASALAVRLATVGPLSGTSAVDGSTTVTSAGSTPRLPAQICVNIVIEPCPMSVELDRTSNRPSAVSAIVARPASRASPEPVNPAPWK